MSKGILVRYNWCSGCKACEAACRQENDLPSNIYGIKVEEIVLNNGRTYNYIPVPTDLCDLCAARIEKGMKPSCAHHCLAKVIEFGEIEQLAKRAEEIKDKTVIWKPKTKPVNK